ncbi:MAG: hypothetical protein AMXMBFR44_0230 [Candidatus Campbellbacteria bacterium]
MQTHLSWEALEYEHKPRNADWFWGLGIIAGGGIILSIIFGNLLFGLVIAIGAVALGLHALRHPNMVQYEITDRGIMINATLFPYPTLQSFWIHEHIIPNQLILTSKKVAMPHIIMQLQGVSSDEVREKLSQYLHEAEVHETFSDRLLALLGF